MARYLADKRKRAALWCIDTHTPVEPRTLADTDGMFSKKAFRATISASLAGFCLLLAILIWSQSWSYRDTWSYQEDGEVFGRRNTGRRKVDWTDYEYLRREEKRSGPGEDGQPVFVDRAREAWIPYKRHPVKNETFFETVNKVIEEYSYNGIASDMISLDRSVPDTRHRYCRLRRYYVDLPQVSVIIVFHNEYLSFLLRTVHSVINRTPDNLLAEIILVDDFSSKDDIKEPLDKHIKEFYPDKVKIIRLPSRSGLMRARMAGIEAAKADIVVVMDAHMEVNTNWLPPLIQPIVDDPRVATEPVVNYIHWDTVEYRRDIDVGGRGAFDWKLDFSFLDRKVSLLGNPANNYENPVFLGAIMAINKTFFWQLGGYDDQLEIWGGEQYDISFKIWMCGNGRILRVPCSQVGHNYKQGGHHPFLNFSLPYIFHNYNRIAEVWFQDYLSYYHNETQGARRNITFGDVSGLLESRQSCKSFDWFLRNVYPEIIFEGPHMDIILGTAFFATLSLLFFLLFLRIVCGSPLWCRTRRLRSYVPLISAT